MLLIIKCIANSEMLKFKKIWMKDKDFTLRMDEI